MTRRVFPILAALAVAGCIGKPSGLAYRHLGIVAASDASGDPIAGFAPACTTLPVLPGSTVDETHAIAPPLEAEVFATRDGAELVFHGAAAGSNADRHIDAALLADTAWSDSVVVASADGTSVTIQLAAACAVP